MKFNANLMWLLTVFYIAAAAGYMVWYGNTHQGGFEPIGSAAISMLAIMCAFLAFYLQMTAKRQGAVPEDRLDAEVEDADFEALKAHGFDDEDAWDIAAITAFFGLSNRMASFSNMMPNPEFYLMGRVPKVK